MQEADIHARLTRLEAQNRRLKRMGALCVLLMAILVLSAQGGDAREGIVEAQRFVLIDKEGNAVGSWGTENGQVVLTVDDNTNACVLSAKALGFSRKMVTTSVSADGVDVRRSTVLHSTLRPEGLRIRGAGDRTRGLLPAIQILRGDAASFVSLFDGDGIERWRAAAGPRGPELRLLSAGHTTVWKAP